ncbi:hypothetical protein Bbelb_087900 [Branchiostoma belcheri]|nr:hypothetical protein Bbelb_087900 [Branchiostoma belcheri]
MKLMICVESTYVIPAKCYVKRALRTEINCPRSNLTSLPSRVPPFTVGVYLQHNRIATIRDLSGFPTVGRLNLSHNLLTTFPWESLKHMKLLVNLDLSHNLLTSLNIDSAFGESIALYEVSVAHNKLTTFSEANLGSPPERARVGYRHRGKGRRYIHGNPILCDCRMYWLAATALAFHQCWPVTCDSTVQHGMLYRDFFQYGLPECSSPENLKGVPVHSASLSACTAGLELTTTSPLKITNTKLSMYVYETGGPDTASKRYFHDTDHSIGILKQETTSLHNTTQRFSVSVQNNTNRNINQTSTEERLAHMTVAISVQAKAVTSTTIIILVIMIFVHYCVFSRNCINESNA